MRYGMISRGAAALVAVVACGGGSTARADTISREAALFDRPVSVQKIPAKSDTDPVGEIMCTYYADLMIRETGTDSPAPGPATIIAGAHPACNAQQAAKAISLKTEDFSLTGRKGRFLVFGATDPNGAVAFMVIDAASGRVLYTDAELTDGLRSVTLENGGLHLRFKRAFNGSCSILKDGAACWAKMAADGNIPHTLAQTPPPVQACAAAYRKGKVPADDPSLISYDVDMALDASGTANVTPRGAVGCAPMP
jgi:hypothetical protein